MVWPQIVVPLLIFTWACSPKKCVALIKAPNHCLLSSSSELSVFVVIVTVLLLFFGLPFLFSLEKNHSEPKQTLFLKLCHWFRALSSPAISTLLRHCLLLAFSAHQL